jgi:hypothetical protein
MMSLDDKSVSDVMIYPGGLQPQQAVESCSKAKHP